MKVTFEYGGDIGVFAEQIAKQDDVIKALGKRIAEIREAVNRGGREGTDRGRR